MSSEIVSANNISIEDIDARIATLINLLKEHRKSVAPVNNAKSKKEDRNTPAAISARIDAIRDVVNNQFANTKPGEKVEFSKIKAACKLEQISCNFNDIGMALADSDDWSFESTKNKFKAIRLDDSNREKIQNAHLLLNHKYANMLRVALGKDELPKPSRIKTKKSVFAKEKVQSKINEVEPEVEPEPDVEQEVGTIPLEEPELDLNLEQGPEPVRQPFQIPQINPQPIDPSFTPNEVN